MLGFSIGYLLFYIFPVFLNIAREMSFLEFIPAHNPIGEDLNFTLRYTEEWILYGRSPYTLGGAFPPITHILFAPLVYVDATIAYKLITYLTLFCYFFSALLVPVWISKSKQNIPPIVFLFLTGLFSYGLHFEMERGQFNIIALFFCLFAVYLFHHKPRFRILAIVLFTISIQLKIYPAIFMVLFIDDWRDWKTTIRRMIGIGAMNFLALFALGKRNFLEFINSLTEIQLTNVEAWIGNHSITSFTQLYSKKELVVPYLQHWPWMIQNAVLLKILLLIFVFVCLITLIYVAYLRNEQGVNTFLLLGCAICTLLIPSISHDYKLSILPAAMAIFFSRYDDSVQSYRMQIFSALTLFLLSGFYSVTLFSYTNKPDYLFNNMPVLLIMLFITTLIAMFSQGQ